MLDQHAQGMADRVAAVVAELLSRHGNAGPVSREVELAKLGMTSIDMVELMLAVEADFDVTIPPVDITMENFRSIASVQLLIERLWSQAPQGDMAAT